jgi:transcriptional regulator with XRE-family HTH domain
MPSQYQRVSRSSRRPENIARESQFMDNTNEEMIGIVARRLRLLIEQLTQSGDRPAARVSTMLGIGDSMVSKILKGKDNVRADTLERVVSAMSLDPAFFFDMTVEEPDHRKYLRRRMSAAKKDPPHWARFAAEWKRYGELSETEREGMKSMLSPDHEIKDGTDWIAVGEWTLARRRPKRQSA